MPVVYDTWIKKKEENPKRRKNFVAIYLLRKNNDVNPDKFDPKPDDVVVGYRSLYFQVKLIVINSFVINECIVKDFFNFKDNGSKVLDTAFRVSKKFRGTGIGAAFTQWKDAFLMKHQPQVYYELIIHGT